MNYIKQLQKDLAEEQQKNKHLLQGIQDIKIYLQSSKFQGLEDHWVNPDDILKRLQEI